MYKNNFDFIIDNMIKNIESKSQNFISMFEDDIEVMKNIELKSKTTAMKIINEHKDDIKSIMSQRDKQIEVINSYHSEFSDIFTHLQKEIIPLAQPMSINYKQREINNYFSSIITTIINCNIFLEKNRQDESSRRAKGYYNNDGTKTSGKIKDAKQSIQKNFKQIIEYLELTDNHQLATSLNEEMEHALNLNFSNDQDILKICYKCLFKSTYKILIAHKYSNDEDKFYKYDSSHEILDKELYKKTKEISLEILTNFFQRPKQTPSIKTFNTFKDLDCLFSYLSKFSY